MLKTVKNSLFCQKRPVGKRPIKKAGSPLRFELFGDFRPACATPGPPPFSIRADDPQIDEQTLSDTVEGLTDLHEIVSAIIRAALADEALATGLKGRIAEMQERLDHLQDRATKRRQIAKDVMVELDLKKITAPDFTVLIRPGMPALLVLDEAAVPSILGNPARPAQSPGIAERTRSRRRPQRRCPLQSRTCVEREDTVMGFSAKQVQALRRSLNQRYVRTREANGRELSYIEGWYAISGSQSDLWLRWDGIERPWTLAACCAGKPWFLPRRLYRPGANFGACWRRNHHLRRPWFG